MDKNERLNALEIALNNEMKEREFYLRNVERTKNILGKVMFKQIGDDELEHYKRLKQLKVEWGKKGIWPETVPLAYRQANFNILTESGRILRRIDMITSSSRREW